MKSKQFLVLVVVTFIGGIVGGFLSGRVASIGQAFASGEKKFKKIEVNVVEANEFRVVSEDTGKILATFRHNPEIRTELKSGGEYVQPEDASLDFIKIKNNLTDYDCRLTPNGLSVFGDGYQTNLNKDGLHAFTTLKGGWDSIDIGFSSTAMSPGLQLKRGSDDRLFIGTNDKGDPQIGLIDSNGKIRAILGHTELKNLSTGSTEIRAESSLVLFNENGNVLWSAP